jgi:hypothetical protein
MGYGSRGNRGYRKRRISIPAGPGGGRESPAMVPQPKLAARSGGRMRAAVLDHRARGCTVG